MKSAFNFSIPSQPFFNRSQIKSNISPHKKSNTKMTDTACAYCTAVCVFTGITGKVVSISILLSTKSLIF